MTGSWAYFLLEISTYSESPRNSILDKGLTCKDNSMGIGFMTVSRNLLEKKETAPNIYNCENGPS